MRVRVFYLNQSGNIGDFEYDSKYSRINAKGIKDEARRMMRLKYGKCAKEIFSLERID